MIVTLHAGESVAERGMAFSDREVWIPAGSPAHAALLGEFRSLADRQYRPNAPNVFLGKRGHSIRTARTQSHDHPAARYKKNSGVPKTSIKIVSKVAQHSNDNRAEHGGYKA